MQRLGWIVAGALAGVVLAMQVPSMAQDTGAPATPSQRVITVTGTATVTSQPDEAVVTLGVHTQADTAQAVLEQNAAKMNKVLDALRGAGLTNDDLATTQVSLNPLALTYLNRLSDLLFILARVANAADGHEEPLWRPGSSA